MIEAIDDSSTASTPRVARLQGNLEPAAHQGANQAAASTRYIGEIDGLRCFAMTGVVAGHCSLMLGWVGVWLFFVISGFVVTKSLRQRIAEPPSITFRNF